MNDELKALRDTLRSIAEEARDALAEIEAITWAARQALQGRDARAIPPDVAEPLRTLLGLVAVIAADQLEQITSRAARFGCDAPAPRPAAPPAGSGTCAPPDQIDI